ncbi:mannose-1-phosphate guanylyltransferase/mannose-6-phosphate isomerase [Deefgea sp. CFH1-16]|uniref:mannose-1-phosphate guanylyltransferase/mannose-6-phosphate isomerase n=1 Tax=Deefgea sp. CFH1-16 TaxID=2675457 RepID=UPI0015F5B153|nr:mannose-1-phosphate guanylyltransferase/mannose-6-phosphate isomerase [Deefgea sp. CFH1-16]MBM5574883.1 mannose-1-phosphate guanylyltransferase/mannose-6-phosphate isomerase [Deefgea sp. CFH1-16]
MTITPVILCGGSGSRMWPLSRGAYPKQFLSLYGDESLLQQTATRLKGLPDVVAPLLISNNEQRFLVAEQLRAVGVVNAKIVLEPIGRNTAPAVAVAAVIALENNPDAILMVLPSDHVIAHRTVFQQLVVQAASVAAQGKLVTFGIAPTEPHTGYGYIRRGAKLLNTTYDVAAFVEKPNIERAKAFLATGEYYWNSGMFMFRADVYLAELEKYQPKMLEQVRAAVAGSVRDLDFVRLELDAFAACPADSIDYAVMEHTEHAAVIAAADLGWNDIGSWAALAEVSTADTEGNNLVGDVMIEGVSNSYIRSESRMIAAIGVDHLVIVETADAILVAHKDKVQDVKNIVNRLQAAGRSESMMHRKVYRPWGSYEGLDSGARFQVKRIIVNPGAALSLQMHYHRAEHWIVVSGTARVVNGDQTLLLCENQSTYIPIGATHRLENPGKFPLEMIEVQSGSYLGEDDIVRFEDTYGRVEVK